MKDCKKFIRLLLVLQLLVVVTGCSLDAVTNRDKETVASNIAETSVATLEEATRWFQQQTTHYEIIRGEVHNDTVVFLTGTKNPGTDSYQLLQVFVVEKNDSVYAVTAMKDGERAMSAGISAHVLVADTLTVVFGDTGDSIFDFINDQRIAVDFTEVHILMKNNTTASRKITGNEPYLLVFTEEVEIFDIAFISSDLTIKYSTFYGDKLLEDTASYDVSNLFA